MKSHLVIMLLLALSAGSQAQPFNPDTSSIPAQVRKDASQVVRSEAIEFEVSDVDHAKYHVHRVETVFSEKGDRSLFFLQQTDKFVSLDDVEIKIYDAAGKTIQKIKEHDIQSIAGVQEFIDDYKTYFYQVRVGSFPVTIETDYKIKFKQTMRYPTYQIMVPGEGIENSSYTVRIHQDIDLRYKTKNIHLDPAITQDGDYKVYTWSVHNLSPIRYEENAVSFESRYPSVLLAPNKFKLDEYEGDMTSWQNFGLWYNGLLRGVDTLPVERKMFYRRLVKNAKTDRDKEKIIYDYLQKNFRYVSIQLGVRGFRPIPADFTDQKKYGDCKGLSNYLVTVLKAVGIKSYLALINAESNREPVDPAFPCNQFNHVIVCIPSAKDTVWLECTSKTTDFGVLGSFTENRNALLITENGGVLVPTPRSQATENVVKAYTTIDLHDDGSGKTSTLFTACGQYKLEMMELKDEKSDDQKMFMINQWGFKDPDQIRFDSSDRRANVQIALDQDLETIPDLKTGTKMFLRPSILDLWAVKLPKAENRTQDFYFKCPFEKFDTTLIKLPEGYGIDAMPQPENDSCKYASYS